MRAFKAFTKKEFVGQIRSAKFNILLGLFILFGVLNPIFAKLIPYLFEILEQTMEQSGINMPIATTTVSDLDSWAQFFANAPLYAIIFFIMQGNIFTKEYGNSTLVMVLTKGLDRKKVLYSKTVTLFSLWTLYYLVYFAATYVFTLWFFDTSLAQSLFVSVLYLWIAGLWLCAMAVFLSTMAKSVGTVLAGVVGSYMLFSLFSIVPSIHRFLPTALIDGTPLIYGTKTPGDFWVSLVIVLVSGAVMLFASVPMFNKKQI